MYKVLVVDDEKLVRKSIINRVNWGKLELIVVAEADNGKKAYDLALELTPEIILVDIKMPIMNGITLIQLIKNSLPNTQFVILSGYDDFEYTKEAIKLGVSNYIKKPIDEEELEETLGKIIKKLDDIHLTQQTMIDLTHQAKSSIHEKQLRYLQQLVHSPIATVDESLELTGPYFALILIYLPDLDSSYKVMEKFRQDILRTIRNFLNSNESSNSPSINPYAFYSEQSQNILCIILNSHRNIDPYYLREISHYLIRAINYNLYISIGGVTQESRSIQEVYNKALYYIKHKILYNHINLLYEDVIEHLFQKDYHKETWIFVHKSLELIQEAVENRDFNGVKNLMNNILSPKYKNRLTIEMIEYVIMQIGSMLKKVMLSYDVEISEYANHDIFVPNCILRYNDITQLRDGICACVYNTLSKYAQFHESNIVDRVKQYIAMHFDEDINVNLIANEFFINPNYLSQIFKNQTGINLSKFIEDTRIDKSMILLSNLELKVKDVAMSVGYKDPNYFSKVFRKSTGMTPTEFRAGL